MNPLIITRAAHDISYNGATEASELGLKPGEWPNEIIMDGKSFAKPGEIWNLNQEFAGMEYTALDGETLTVFND